MGPLLVLVSGAPGSGKTTLARRLAADLVTPLLSKDTVKEALADAFGVDSVERSREVGRASIAALYALTRDQLDLGVSVVVDHAFHRDLADAVVPLLEQSTGVLVHCHAPGEVLGQRVLARSDRGERHPVHFDREIQPIDRARYEPMELLDVPVLLVDSSDGYRPDYPTILSFVEGAR